MIFVTGGTGLLGAHLLWEILKTETVVRASYRDEKSLDKTLHIFSYYGPNARQVFERIEWVRVDLLDIPALEKALSGIQKVYHAAGMISFDPRDYKALCRANITGTTNLVNACLHEGVRKLCYVSSIATLGKPVKGKWMDEKADLQTPASNVYALSKHGAEMEVWRGTQEGLPAVIVNPGVILGPGSWDSGSGSIVKRVARGSRIYPPGGSGFIGVQDVCRTMVALMGSTLQQERFILVAENLSYQELSTKIAAALGVAPPKYRIRTWQLPLLWRLDWLRAILTCKKRVLTRHGAKSLRKRTWYDASKIQAVLPFDFRPIDEVVAAAAKLYQQDRDKGLV